VDNFQFFFRFVGFDYLCFYVKIKVIIDFFKNIVLKIINLVFNIFKYIL
jgi:hypothetical protein